jgi:hypothetical protein
MDHVDSSDSDSGVFDDWQWHVEGSFPADSPREQAYVHIGVFTVWLAGRGMLASAFAEGPAGPAISALLDRSGSVVSLRESTAGRLYAELLTPEGLAFTGAYYAPEYGYARDWQRAFGRKADAYAVPATWQTYDRIEPVIERRYAEWIASGRPELMPLPGVLGKLARLLDRRRQPS